MGLAWAQVAFHMGKQTCEWKHITVRDGEQLKLSCSVQQLWVLRDTPGTTLWNPRFLLRIHTWQIVWRTHTHLVSPDTHSATTHLPFALVLHGSEDMWHLLQDWSSEFRLQPRSLCGQTVKTLSVKTIMEKSGKLHFGIITSSKEMMFLDAFVCLPLSSIIQKVKSGL